jgi:AcrR family transcriptional regulator
MTPKRNYTLGRRAETAAETRQRIIEATHALHVERGISATSLRDIAEQAGVSVGTAYHHFPTYLDAIRACGEYTVRISALPDDSIFDGVEAPDDRVRILVRELCGWYARNSWFERIRAERSLYPPVEEGMTHFEHSIEQLARTAARCTADEARTIAALTDVAVHSSLRRAGMPAERIPGRIADIVLTWFLSPSRRRTVRPAPKTQQARRQS